MVIPLLKVRVPTCPMVEPSVVAPERVKLSVPGLQLSLVNASGTTTDFVHPLVRFVEMLDAGVSTGSVLSVTVTT